MEKSGLIKCTKIKSVLNQEKLGLNQRKNLIYWDFAYICHFEIILK